MALDGVAASPVIARASAIGARAQRMAFRSMRSLLRSDAPEPQHALPASARGQRADRGGPFPRLVIRRAGGREMGHYVVVTPRLQAGLTPVLLCPARALAHTAAGCG